ncbi:MAG: hypothetical protein QM669_07455 [Siphonobacter sp.]
MKYNLPAAYSAAIKYLSNTNTPGVTADMKEASTNCTSGWNTNPASFTFKQDTWYHFIATFDGTNSYIYINGERSGRKEGNVGVMSPDCSLGAFLRFGIQYLGLYPEYFSGAFDDIRIYNIPLTQAHVTAL